MKILQVTPFFSPVHGGSAEVPYQLCKELLKRGHEVTIYTSDYKLSQEYLSSVPEARIYAFKTWLRGAKFFITPEMIRQARKEIEYFDIVHLHNYYTFQNIILHYYAQKRQIPYILQAHGSVATYFQKEMLKRAFDKIWGYRILRDAWKLIAITPVEAKQYQDMGIGKDRIAVIPHGIDLTEFENLPQRGEFREKYGLSDSQKIILYLGRIDKVKGLNVLVKAFNDLTKELGEAKLVIVGPDDGYLSALRRSVKEFHIEKNVLFTGPLYGENKLTAYVDADVCVLPSFYEIFGIVALEALACGTPVIVTDRCGVASWIGSNSYVVQFGEAQLKEAMLEVLGNEGNFRRANTREFIKKHFTWAKVAERIERIYKNATLNLS